jgi:hypothetical protein
MQSYSCLSLGGAAPAVRILGAVAAALQAGQVEHAEALVSLNAATQQPQVRAALRARAVAVLLGRVAYQPRPVARKQRGGREVAVRACGAASATPSAGTVGTDRHPRTGTWAECEPLGTCAP